MGIKARKNKFIFDPHYSTNVFVPFDLKSCDCVDATVIHILDCLPGSAYTNQPSWMENDGVEGNLENQS